MLSPAGVAASILCVRAPRLWFLAGPGQLESISVCYQRDDELDLDIVLSLACCDDLVHAESALVVQKTSASSMLSSEPDVSGRICL